MASSSSSLDYCVSPSCIGAACTHFSSWVLNGVHSFYTNNGVLYLRFNNFGSIQQVEIYKDVSYFYLVALGQGTVGSITITERNSSGISGSVLWDGVPVSFSTVARLNCLDNSSSSTSSFDSSSTSTSSSESTGCCVTPICHGVACSNFTSWNFTSLTKSNSNNCRLYIGLEFVNPYQQVRVYSNSTLTTLVAIGQRSGSGLITINQVSGSGLDGSVSWDGTPFTYDNTLILDCKQSSSSSSTSIDSSSSSSYYSESSLSSSSSTSSSSSIDSSSSSSSNSSSSWGYSSSSSSSTTSNSSSSSIDSSSSSSSSSSSHSSESIGNTSSSSSSPLEIWNQSKPLILANSAISTISTQNRLSQAILLQDTSYEIGKIYCYLYSSKDVHAFNIYLSICEGNIDGSPSTVIATATLDASTIIQDGWYSFEFNISGISPSNNILSFVMWQDGGNEENYVMWGYSVNESSTYAWISNDNIIWDDQPGIVRAIRIVGVFDVFDLNNYQVNSPPSLIRELIAPMNSNSATYSHTEFLSDPSKVELNQPDLIVSFVVDSSGSMGWGDRFGNRIEFVNTVASRFLDYYPSNVLFDIVKFGALVADANTITSNMGQVMAINLDISNPDRTTYIFTTDNNIFRVYKGDVYSHNGFTYTAVDDYNVVSIVVFIGDGAPLDEGTLTKVSGGGDNTIVFRSFEVISADTNYFVAIGLKALENGHTYNFGGISVDDLSLSGMDTNLWQLLYSSPDSPSVTLANNGPRDSESIDIVATESLVARSPFGSDFEYANITSAVTRWETDVSVSNVEPFITGSRIDLVDRVYLSSNLVVASNSGSSIAFTPAVAFNIGEKNSQGGMIQTSSFLNKVIFTGTTVQLYLRDTAVTRDIIFYIQSLDGYLMEWDIKASDQWYIHNLYWLGETALLPISVFDKNGVPFPDGTRIELEVDQRASIVEQTSVEHQNLVEVANTGADTVYVESLEGFTRDQNVTLVDRQQQIQILKIEQLGQDDNGYYVQFYTTLIYNFDPNNGATLVPSSTANSEAGSSPVAIALSMVDVTPIYAERDLDPSFREPYDPPNVSSSTTYDALNNVSAYIKEGLFNIPTIDGNGVVRILPITEDVLKTIDEKASDAANLLRMEPPEDFVGQNEQTTGDLEGLSVDTQTSSATQGLDYTIETPVYLYGGETESAMTTTSIDLEAKTFDGLTIPGISTDNLLALFVKEYNIYPSITKISKTNVVVSKQYFDPFLVDFTPPYNVVSIRDDLTKVVPFWIPEYDDTCGYFIGYTQNNLYGVYASDENGAYTINYIVTNKFRLVPSATIDIHVYTNKVVDVENLAYNGIVDSSYFLNVKYPDIVSVSNGVTVTTPHLSEIDTWREAVTNNPYGILLEEANNTFGSSLSDLIGSSLSDLIVSQSTESTESSIRTPEAVNLFYTNPNEWTNATQYDVYTTTLNVINGRATFTLPSSETPSVVFVEASLTFNEQFEAIRGDIIIVANPITVGPLYENILEPQDGVTFELTSNITWMDGSEIIDDGVQVEVTPTSTNLIPSVSETTNGYIDGLFFGPHAPYIYNNNGTTDCPPTQLLENVTVKANHPSGYTTSVTRIICWQGIEGEGVDNQFYFYVQGSGTAWADGDPLTTNIFSDLGHPQNILWIGEDGILRLLGYMQDGDLNRFVSGNTIPSRQRWGEEISEEVTFRTQPVNKNVGSSLETEIKLQTGYKGETRNYIGEGVMSLPELGIEAEYPKSVFLDPLGIDISLEAYNNLFIRDGNHSPNIVAEVTWRGKPITRKFYPPTLPDSNVFADYSLPSVTFRSGICSQVNNDGNPDTPEPIDNRGPLDSCLDITNNSDATLTSYTVETGLIRTDIYDDTINSHTHACTIDINRDEGLTTSTILLTGSIENHSHIVTWDETERKYITDTVLSHSHYVRCVAITQLNPTTNTGLEIFINGYVVYDPTVAIPHALGSKPYYFPVLPDGNRIMFNTLDILGYTPSQPILTLKLETGTDLHNYPLEAVTIPELSSELDPNLPAYFTAETPYQTPRGFDVRAVANFSAYVYESSPGVSNVVAERTVDDGSRITWEVIPYKVNKEGSLIGGESGWDDTNVNIVAPDLIKKYMVLKFKASIAAEGQFASREFYILVNSNLQWISGIVSLMPELSNDSSYITTALSQIEYLGGSQLHDAVKEATQRIIQEQTDEPSYKNYEKVLVLVTDGDENSSEYSLSQATDGISFIDGTDETPALGIRLGNTDTFNEVVIKKYAERTNGEVYPMVNLSSGDIINLVDYIIETSSAGFNYGTYRNMLSFTQTSIPIEFRLGSVLLPSGGAINYRTRYTIDGQQWSSWSDWKNNDIITYPSDPNQKILQFQYEVEFYGNGQFEKPILYGETICGNSGQVIKYNSPQSFTVFFKPVSIGTTDYEYLSSIHITHEANIPETSTISYGLVQSGDLNLEEYMIDSKFINADNHTVLLTRYNESLISENFRTYSALNGRWPSSCSIEVYKFNSQNPDGILVNFSEYSSNSITGEITFYNYQSSTDTFTINIIFRPFFRLIAKITNYSQESAIIHHIGVIYNTSKRVPTDSDGNIIHKSISQRVNLSCVEDTI